MRRLHAVRKHEIFVASGVYEFEQVGKRTGLIEHWSIHEVGDAQFIRVDKDGRSWDGRSWLYEALCNPDGQIERADLRAYGNSQDAVKQVRASYTFFDERVEVIRVVNNNLRFEEEVVMPAGYTIQLGAQVLDSLMIPHMNETQVRVFSTLPYVFFNPHLAFMGRNLTTADMHFAGGEEIELGGKSYSAQVYQGTYGRVWLDQFDILLCKESPSLTVMLKQYAHRPEPQSHD